MTVRDYDDFLIGLDPDARNEGSPDGLIWGDPAMKTRAVGTTWMASMAVLEQAAAKGINLIITHEPTFWYHGIPKAPELSLCEQDGVDMSFKTGFLEAHGIAILRAHDCWIRYPEYGIEDSLRSALGIPAPIKRLGKLHSCYEISRTTLGELALKCKEKTNLSSVRVSGDLKGTVKRLVLAYGAGSGTKWYYSYRQQGVDAVITGEQSEWAHVRPAIDMGLGVIELGHAKSETFGMEGMARLLRERFPDVPAEHLPTSDSFQYV